jgi:hypothetical protein
VQDIRGLKVERTEIARKSFGPIQEGNYVPQKANNPDARLQ